MQTVPTTLLDQRLENFQTVAPVIEPLKRAIAQDLAPQVQDIDLNGVYPRSFMHQVGALGGFGHAVSPEFGGSGQGLKAAIQVIEAISQTCLCTGFMAWCQIACTWYLQNSDNTDLKHHLLPQVASGQVLGGTGLSNPMKHFAGIEKIALVAEPQPGGYVINGLLPWVSNIGVGHPFGVAAKIADTDAYLMAIVSDNFAGLTLKQNAHFIALEGSGTFSCVFKDVFVPDEFILAVPCNDYVERIRPGFILTQVGMGLGLVAGCIDVMERYSQRLGHVNCFLDEPIADFVDELKQVRLKTYALADAIADRPVVTTNVLKDIIQARIVASELSLRAANAAMLHAGARAYLQGSEPARRLREAYFVAIVTPAIKHLKKLLHQL